MWANLIKTGGAIVILNELAKRATQVRQSQVKSMKNRRLRHLAIGAGIGTAVGITTGILFAPKAGRETRQQIAEKTGNIAASMKENVASAKTKITESVKETGARLQEAGTQGVDAAKESLKKTENQKKKESKK